jgi:hypothetical protein
MRAGVVADRPPKLVREMLSVTTAPPVNGASIFVESPPSGRVSHDAMNAAASRTIFADSARPRSSSSAAIMRKQLERCRLVLIEPFQ